MTRGLAQAVHLVHVAIVVMVLSWERLAIPTVYALCPSAARGRFCAAHLLAPRPHRRKAVFSSAHELVNLTNTVLRTIKVAAEA